MFNNKMHDINPLDIIFIGIIRYEVTLKDKADDHKMFKFRIVVATALQKCLYYHEL